jgi:hypothetical protein
MPGCMTSSDAESRDCTFRMPHGEIWYCPDDGGINPYNYGCVGMGVDRPKDFPYSQVCCPTGP